MYCLDCFPRSSKNAPEIEVHNEKKDDKEENVKPPPIPKKKKKKINP